MRRLLFVVSALAMTVFVAGEGAAETKTLRRGSPAELVDMLGLRVGMTLAEAQAVIAKHGARIPDVSPYDELEPKGVRPHLEGPDPVLFRLYVRMPWGYAGPRVQMKVGWHLRVFPKDARGDYREPENLIVYYIHYVVFGPEAASGEAAELMPREEFMAAARSAFPDLIDSTAEATSEEREHCLNADTRIWAMEKLTSYRRAGDNVNLYEAGDPSTAVWRNCGRILRVSTREDSGQGVGEVAVTRFDTHLAEEAFTNLSQVVGYTEEIRKEVESRRQ
jgi:hypothetical protein